MLVENTIAVCPSFTSYARSYWYSPDFSFRMGVNHSLWTIICNLCSVKTYLIFINLATNNGIDFILFVWIIIYKTEILETIIQLHLVVACIITPFVSTCLRSFRNPIIISTCLITTIFNGRIKNSLCIQSFCCMVVVR